MCAPNGRRGHARWLWPIALLLAVPAHAVEVETLLDQAEAALAAGRPGEAEGLYRQALAVRPSSARATRGLAEVLAARGRAEEAAAQLLALGGRALHLDRPAEAVADLRRAAELLPAAADGHALLGEALTRSAQYRAAVEPLQRAVGLGRHDERTLVALGIALWETRREPEAEEALRRAIAAAQAPYFALTQLGRLLLWQRRYDEARSALERAVLLRNDDVESQLDLCRAFSGVGDAAAAVARCRRAVEIAPGLPRARHALAAALSRGGDGEAARRELAAYAQLQQDAQEAERLAMQSRARLDHGWDLLQRGEAAAAASHFRSLPEEPEALAGQALALSALGRHREAVRVLESAVGRHPERHNLQQLLAEERRAAAALP